MDNETPQFKEIEKERKIFDNAEDVIKFWKSLWCRPDKGGPHAEWLNEYADYFCTLSLNSISWELRRYEGYTLSKPICEKITHLFFIKRVITVK